MSLVLTSLALVGVAAGAAAPAQAAAAPSGSAALRGQEYVALGDSYAAGYGLGSLTGDPVSACGQSSRDYPHRVASALGARLTDVSCAGATTANVLDTKQDGAAPQVDALSKRTKLVTLSIGGNDAGLFATAQKCIALSATGPIFGASAGATSCRSEFVKNGQDTLAHAIETTTAGDLATTFRAIEKRAPHATVVVVGYPAIFPDKAHTPVAGCYRPVVDAKSLVDGFPKDGFPFTSTDVAYLSGVQATLDAVTAKAASAAGVTYVSTLAASEAHSGCTTTGSYIAGITLDASEYFTSISLQTGALHPNARGAAFLASQTTAGISRALAPTATPTPTSSATASHRPPELVWIALVAALVAAFLTLLAANAGRRRRARDRRRP